MNDAVWFALINGKKEGPFTPQQLRHDFRVTPDTLICKKGWSDWVPLRNIPELNFLFGDEKTQEELLPLKKKISPTTGKEEIALDIQKEQFPIFFWIILFIVILYLIYEFQNYFA